MNTSRSRLPRRLAACVFSIVAASPAIADSVQLGAMPGGAFRIPVTTLFEARFKTTVRQREDFSCGSAALATLLTYHYHRPVGEREVLDAMYAQGDQEKIRHEGFSLLDMKRYLESRGLQADGYHVPLDRLGETGTPAIALIREGTYHHFVVVKGIRDRELVIGDPARGTRVMPRSEFESAWVNQIVFVIHGEDVAGDFNARSDWSVRPRSPLGDAISRESLGVLTLPRPGINQF